MKEPTEGQDGREQSDARSQRAPARPSIAKMAVAGALTIGLMPLNARFLIDSESIRYAGFPSTISLFYNVVFVLLVVSLANAPLRRFAPKLVLGPQEMAVMYIGLCVASTVAAHDSMQVLAPAMAHAHKYQTPENNWGELILPYLPKWLTVSDAHSLKNLYEGNANLKDPGVYRPWLGPAAWWLLFYTAFNVGTLAVVSLFRRRWIESERLSFPVAQVPMEIMHGRGGFLRDPVTWVVLLITLGIDVLNGLHVLHPIVPQIPTRGEAVPAFNLGGQVTDRPWNAIGFTPIAFYPIVIGLGLLLPSELALSCWFFFWFWRLALVLTRAWGLEVVPEFPYIRYQMFGGYMGIAAVALYLSRRYIGEVYRSVIGREKSDLSREAMSYRTAAIVLAVCFAVLVVFSIVAGMSWWYAILFFLIYFVIAFSISRIRAEMGLPCHDLHFAGPTDILPAMIGTLNLTRPTRVVSWLYWWFNRAYRNHAGPHHIEAFKICEQTGLSPKVAGVTIVLGTVLGVVAAFWGALWCYASFGAAQGSPFNFGGELYGHMATSLDAPQKANGGAAIAGLLGFGLMVVTLILKVRLPWIPIHPAGYAVAASWSMQFMWCPLLIAWAVKGLTTRYGGGRYSRRLVSIAFGLILGDLIGGVFWSSYGIYIKKQIYSIFQ